MGKCVEAIYPPQYRAGGALVVLGLRACHLTSSGTLARAADHDRARAPDNRRDALGLFSRSVATVARPTSRSIAQEPICRARADLRCAGLGNQRSFLGEVGVNQVKTCGSTHIGSHDPC